MSLSLKWNAGDSLGAAMAFLVMGCVCAALALWQQSVEIVGRATIRDMELCLDRYARNNAVHPDDRQCGLLQDRLLSDAGRSELRTAIASGRDAEMQDRGLATRGWVGAGACGVAVVFFLVFGVLGLRRSGADSPGAPSNTPPPWHR